MKFLRFSPILKLFKSFAKTDATAHSNSACGLTLYDRIEEIISIADFRQDNSEIIKKFYALTDIQQQLTVVTLIEHNMVETLEVILQSLFDINFLIKGQTPLHFAIKDENLNMVRVLLKYDADTELNDVFKETALNCAVRTGNAEIIQYLLEQGAEVDTQASDSNTPLAFAVHQGDINTVSLLEKYGSSL